MSKENPSSISKDGEETVIKKKDGGEIRIDPRGKNLGETKESFIADAIVESASENKEDRMRAFRERRVLEIEEVSETDASHVVAGKDRRKESSSSPFTLEESEASAAGDAWDVPENTEVEGFHSLGALFVALESDLKQASRAPAFSEDKEMDEKKSRLLSAVRVLRGFGYKTIDEAVREIRGANKEDAPLLGTIKSIAEVDAEIIEDNDVRGAIQRIQRAAIERLEEAEHSD